MEREMREIDCDRSREIDGGMRERERERETGLERLEER